MKRVAVLRSAVVFTFGLLFIGHALALPVAYDDLETWHTAVGAPALLETFNSISADTEILNWNRPPEPTGSTDVNGNFSLSEAGDILSVPTNWIDNLGDNSVPTGGIPVDGTTYFRGSVQDQGAESAARTRILIIFPEDIIAFGAEFAGIADAGAGLEYATATEFTGFPATNFTEIPLEPESDGFWGFTSTEPFNVVFLQVKDYDGPGPLDLGGEGFGMDNVRWAPVPEPVTLGDIIAYFKTSVKEKKIEGIGKFRIVKKAQIQAFRLILNIANSIFKDPEHETDDACLVLERALLRSDGDQYLLTDLIQDVDNSGATHELAVKILEFVDYNGCARACGYGM